MYGADPNWGRIIASLGSIDSQFINPNKNKLLINNIRVKSSSKKIFIEKKRILKLK